jgi:hypothetical protein
MKSLMEYKGLLALGILILIHLVSACGLAHWVYQIYGTYIFPLIRTIYDYTLGMIPFASIYILIVVLLLLFFFRKYKKAGSKSKTWVYHILSTFNFLGWVIFLFYFLWGFNYYRPSWIEKHGHTAVNPDSAMIIQEIQTVSARVNELRIKISEDTSALSYHPDWTIMENDIRIEQKRFLTSYGDKAIGRVRIRQLYPKGVLLSLSTAGIYIPLVCEGHIDPGLNPIQWPFTLAHEMAHGYGYTDEGECNFIGFVTCIQSEDPHIQYSGWLGYWRYLYREVDHLSEEKADRVYASMFPGVKADLKAIRKDINRYPDILPWFRDVIYDFYLKSHGMSDGLASYDGIISLVLTWKKETAF